jgi:hypothetical protein
MAAHATVLGPRHTHELREEDGKVVLRRVRVNCGLSACRCRGQRR